MDGARAIALPTPRILTRYVVPNIIGPVVVYSTLLIPVNIIVEIPLSFLGLGVQEPLTSLGLLITQGATMLDPSSSMQVFPPVLLAIPMLSFHPHGTGRRESPGPRGPEAHGSAPGPLPHVPPFPPP